MANDLRLTDKQRELASENHNLIYCFANKKNISIDEYYGILAIGLCNAVKIYDKHKNKFSTLAYHCMQNELYRHWRETQRKSVIPQELIFSYNAPIEARDSEGNDFSEIFSDNDAYESMDYAIILSEFKSSLTEKESIIVEMLMSGMKHHEIADKLNCSRQNIDYYVKAIRNKVDDYLNS